MTTPSPKTLEEIYKAKEIRRKTLAMLPIEEKIDIVEQLQGLGKAMIEARKMLKMNLPFSEIKILGQDEAETLVNKTEPNKWNVVSLWSGGGGRHGYSQPSFTGALDICQRRFHDIIRKEKETDMLCSNQDIIDILEFARSKRGNPLVVHCFAGISRSTAITFLILLDAMQDLLEFPVEEALKIVFKIRPIMYPNRHIITQGLSIIAGESTLKQITWFRELYNSREFAKIMGNVYISLI